MMSSDAVDDVNATFNECSAFVRDTTLPEDVLARYVPGLLVREPTFCDASARLGGFVAPHRYLIFSSDARSLEDFEPEKWGLCAWLPNRRLKVVDRLSADGYTQITLLEIPEHLLPWFAASEANAIELAFATHGRELFTQLRNAAPIPELDSDLWRNRLAHPVGVNDQGRAFSLYINEEYAADQVRPRAARVLPYLARFLSEEGYYGEAEDALQAAVVAQRPFVDRDPESPALLLLALGELRLNLNDESAAESDLLEALGLFQRLTEDRLPVARTLLRLGHIYNKKGEAGAAERHYIHALKIARRETGDRSDLTATLLTSLGALYERWGRYDDAAAHLDEAVSIERGLYGRARQQTLNNVARLQQARGDLDAALATFEEARAGSVAPPSDLEELTLDANIAELIAARGELDEAFTQLEAVVAGERCVIDDYAALVPERAQLELVRLGRIRIDQCLTLALTDGGDTRRRAQAAVELLLRRKGLAGDLAARRRDHIQAGHSGETRQRLDELATLRSQIAQRRLAGPAHEPVDLFTESLRKDELRREELERQLARTVPHIGRQYTDRQSSMARAIAERIPSDSVVIEYFRFARFNFSAVHTRGEPPWDSERYVAVILSPERSEEPELVDLADANLVDGLVSEVRRAITGGPDVRAHETRDLLRQGTLPMAEDWTAATQLRDAIVDPLLSRLGDARRLLLAPDGDLLMLPFDMLPSQNGSTLADDFTISYLSTARDVLQRNPETKALSGRSLVLADPDYDAGSETNAPTGQPFGRLEGTKAEGERVAEALQARLRLGREATKSSLHVGDVPTVLHIATHGFLLQERRRPLSPDDFNHLQPGVVIRSTDPDRAILALNGTIATPVDFEVADDEPFERLSGRDLRNPLLRSGLALAGANTWLRGAEPPSDAGNGILTAEEVLGMDLSGTALVVLSACETGLGEIRAGEGIFGLRRAFLLAGARTLVTSLWKVPDAETASLMEDFYRRLLTGRAPDEALREAKAEMRASHPEPFFWAAFICIGADRPIGGMINHPEPRGD